MLKNTYFLLFFCTSLTFSQNIEDGSKRDRLSQIFPDSIEISAEGEKNDITNMKGEVYTPIDFRLNQNYPNPFNPSTNVSFYLPVKAITLLTVHSANGERVATLINGEIPAGEHTTTFNGSGYASGMYFCKLEAGGYIEVKKMMMLK